MDERGKRRRFAARCAIVAVVAACALPGMGCRWLPMLRPQSNLDPRTLSDLATTPAEPPALVAATLPLASEPLPPLPELHAVAPPATGIGPNLEQAKQLASSQDRAVARDVEVVRATANETPAAAALVMPEVEAMAQEKPAAPPESDPVDAWRAGLEALRDLARTQAVKEAQRGHPGDWWARHQVLDRLMRTDGTLWAALTHKLDEAAADPVAVERPEPSEQEKQATEPDKPANDHVPLLQVNCVALCKKVEGFGQYEPIEPVVVARGQGVVLYWEVEGVASEAKGDAFRTRLSSTVELCKGDAAEPVYRKGLGTVEDTCRRRRRDFFVNARWTTPEQIEPGHYVLTILVEDDLGHTRARGELAVEIR